METTAKQRITTRNMVLCALFAALIAIGAFIRIPVPYVPITFQGFFVLLAGFLLGPKYGAASMLIYIAVGLVGIPVFTETDVRLPDRLCGMRLCGRDTYPEVEEADGWPSFCYGYDRHDTGLYHWNAVLLFHHELCA